ncbi:hypothetical protein [Ruegeria aquimaris]|nr:hypothetical protein [Ruegeria sp. XHP0148]
MNLSSLSCFARSLKRPGECVDFCRSEAALSGTKSGAQLESPHAHPKGSA